MSVGALPAASRLRYTSSPHRDARTFNLRPDNFARDEARARLLGDLDRAVAACLQGFGSTGDKRRKVQERLGSRPLAALRSAGVLAAGGWWLRAIFEQPASATAEDFDAVEVLADVLHRLETEVWSGFDELAQVKVAFYGSVNPVHFAPAAFTFGETCAVASWLGSLSRFMPTTLPDFVGAYWDTIIGEQAVWPDSDWPPDAFLIEKAAGFMSPKDLRGWIDAAQTSSPSAKREKNSLIISGVNDAKPTARHIVSARSHR